MNLSDYFDNTKGCGVLATADSAGKVNAAVYARPHFFDEKNRGPSPFAFVSCVGGHSDRWRLGRTLEAFQVQHSAMSGQTELCFLTGH